MSTLCIVQCPHSQVAVAPHAEALGGASAARVVVHPQHNGPVPLVSHVLWGSGAQPQPAAPTPAAAAPVAVMEAAQAESMIFAGVPKGGKVKHSKRARMAYQTSFF